MPPHGNGTAWWQGEIDAKVRKIEGEVEELWKLKNEEDKRMTRLEVRIASLISMGSGLIILVQHFWK